MQTKPCFWQFIVMSLMLLPACEPAPRLPTSTTTPYPPLPTTPVPQPTPLATQTKFAAPTSTMALSAGYQENCLTVENSLPTGFLSDGEIILADNDPRKMGFTLSTLSAVDNTLRLLPDSKFDHVPYVSPDGKWLAHDIERTSDQGQPQEFLEIRSLDGLQRRAIPWSKDWYGLSGWVDTENIKLQLDPVNTIGVLNTSTGKMKKFDFSAPELYVVRTGGITLDPQLTRVVYQYNNVEEFTRWVLLDLQSKKELWRRDIGYQPWTTPDWTPDGTRFAVGLPTDVPDGFMELYIVDRAGNEQQATHLEKAGLQAEILQTRWSPDQRYIAFWLGNMLAVFDDATGVTTNYCIHSRNSIGDDFYWSPDSKQLALNYAYNKNEADSESGRVVVVDLLKNEAIEIATNSIVIGWMPSLASSNQPAYP